MESLKPLCLVDRSIRLSPNEESQLEHCFDIQYVDSSTSDLSLFEQCSAFLVHSYLPQAILSSLHQCKYIGIRAHNLDYVPLEVLPNKSVVVEGIPAVTQNAVAEHVFAMIFYLTKQLGKARQNIISGQWRSGLETNVELYGKYLGIIGNGEIGQTEPASGEYLACYSKSYSLFSVITLSKLS